MHLLDIDHPAALALIVRVTSHLPIGASLGRIFVVSPQGIVAGGGATYGADRVDDYVWRLVEIDGELQEMTRWRNGEEIGRRVVRVPPDDWGA